MVVEVDTLDPEPVAIQGGLLAGLAERGGDGVLWLVAGTARQAPGAAVMAPQGALLHQDVRQPRGVMVDGEQPGGAVDAPVPMSAITLGPPVTVFGRHGTNDAPRNPDLRERTVRRTRGRSAAALGEVRVLGPHQTPPHPQPTFAKALTHPVAGG